MGVSSKRSSTCLLAHYKAQRVRTLFVDGIFFQHAGATAAVAQSHDRAVDAEDGVVGLRELEVVVGVIEIGSRIVEGGETEGSIDSLRTECFSILGLEGG